MHTKFFTKMTMSQKLIDILYPVNSSYNQLSNKNLLYNKPGDFAKKKNQPSLSMCVYPGNAKN